MVKGSKQSPEARLKMSLAHKKRGTVPPSRLGIPNSAEAKRKISEKLRDGRVRWTEERKQAAREAWTGEANPAWKGGVTPESRKIRMTAEYKNWRMSVWERDGFTCQNCGGKPGKIHADHIKPFSLYPESRFDLDNGRTLCIPCHKEIGWKYRPNKKGLQHAA